MQEEFPIRFEEYLEAVQCRVPLGLRSKITSSIYDPNHAISRDAAEKFREKIAYHDKKAKSRWHRWHRFVGWLFGIEKKRLLLALHDFMYGLTKLQSASDIISRRHHLIIPVHMDPAIRVLAIRVLVLGEIWNKLIRPIKIWMGMEEHDEGDASAAWKDYSRHAAIGSNNQDRNSKIMESPTPSRVNTDREVDSNDLPPTAATSKEVDPGKHSTTYSIWAQPPGPVAAPTPEEAPSNEGNGPTGR